MAKGKSINLLHYQYTPQPYKDMKKDIIAYDQVKRLGFEFGQFDDEVAVKGHPHIYADKTIGLILKDNTIYSVTAHWDCEDLTVKICHNKHGDFENSKQVRVIDTFFELVTLMETLNPNEN